MKTAVNYEFGYEPNSEAKKHTNIGTKAYLKVLCNKNDLRGNKMANFSQTSQIMNDTKKPESSELIDIKNVEIGQDSPIAQRLINFVEQIKNPYLFKVDGVTVKVNFSDDGPAFQDKFLSYLKTVSMK